MAYVDLNQVRAVTYISSEFPLFPFSFLLRVVIVVLVARVQANATRRPKMMRKGEGWVSDGGNGRKKPNTVIRGQIKTVKNGAEENR